MSDKNNIRGGKTIPFADGVDRTIYPLRIKQLRKFVKVIEKMGDTSDATSMTDEDIDLMVSAAAIILDKVDPALAADTDALEDAVDLLVFNDMMSVAMGNASPEG